jgi:hypothetical protein
MLSQWKLFDNLRRSLVPAALTSMLLLGWTVLSPAWFWTAVVLMILLMPYVIASLSNLADKPAEVTFRQHLAAVESAAQRHGVQALIALSFLPYEAFFCLDAIVRTIGRMLITRRRLLEWNPSSDEDKALEQRGRTDLLTSYRCMVVAPTIAAIAWVGLSLTRPAVLAVAGPILLLWAASPALAWWLSRPLPRRSARLTVDQTHFLRKLVRKTWAYFETYVGPDDHWLPPDNVQEHPTIRVAHRTSPTNMGLALLSTLAAHDFGYVSAGQLVIRTTNALRSMESLERHRGHFYNWYDTETLLPLAPRYVSTVDSGNLGGHLLTLRPGLMELIDAPILNKRWLEGISDTFAILVGAVGKNPPVSVTEFEKALEWTATATPSTLTNAWVQLELLVAYAADTANDFKGSLAESVESEARFWPAHSRSNARNCAMNWLFLRLGSSSERCREQVPTSRARTVSRRFASLRGLTCHRPRCPNVSRRPPKGEPCSTCCMLS